MWKVLGGLEFGMLVKVKMILCYKLKRLARDDIWKVMSVQVIPTLVIEKAEG